MTKTLSTESMEVNFAAGCFAEFTNVTQIVVRGTVEHPVLGSRIFRASATQQREAEGGYAESHTEGTFEEMEEYEHGFGIVDTHIAVQLLTEFRNWLDNTPSDLDGKLYRVEASEIGEYL